MSIAVLTQVYDEMRRLAIAGSVVVGGDFRLKKLIAPLEKSGEKAPVFAKVAQATRAVVESNEKTAAAALLELATLVNAILYTQGETGLAGELQPIETTNLGSQQTQASARVLKPLLEALSTTGSGRLELIRDAIERGAFRDLRLVKPALQAIDDPFPEIAELIAEKVLPLYGQAILPELRAKFDRKGKAGNLRRLSLMHQLDPVATRELVKQVLDEGSKELKLVAIGCLGDSDDDFAYLLEQSKAKAKDVRAAALGALTKLQLPDAIQTVLKAAAGADLELIAEQLRTSAHPEFLAFVLSETDKKLGELLKLKEKKPQATAIIRLQHLLRCLDGRDDSGTEAVLLKCFERAADLTAIKSEPSGADVNEMVAALMAHSSQRACETLIAAQKSLSGPMLSQAFLAARRTLSPATLFDIFSASLRIKPEKKLMKSSMAVARFEAIRDGLLSDDQYVGSRYHRGWRFGAINDEEPEKLPELDPRWLDVAVEAAQLEIVLPLARPGNAAANQFLLEQFRALGKNKEYEARRILETMIRVQHPQATATVVQLIQRVSKTPHAGYAGYWLGRMISELPKESAPQLEALLPTLPEKLVDQLMEFVLALKNKTA